MFLLATYSTCMLFIILVSLHFLLAKSLGFMAFGIGFGFGHVATRKAMTCRNTVTCDLADKCDINYLLTTRTCSFMLKRLSGCSKPLTAPRCFFTSHSRFDSREKEQGEISQEEYLRQRRTELKRKQRVRINAAVLLGQLK